GTSRGGDAHGITGESYWAMESKSPMLDIELQRDRRGEVTREILRSPPPDSGSPEIPWRIFGWYQYVRNAEGQLRQLIYHSHSSQDTSQPSDDDPVLSSVEIDCGLGARNPRGAIIYSPISSPRGTGQQASIRFDYDSGGRLIGGTRQGLWSSHFSVTGGVCEETPERLFVILLGAHGGPWHTLDFGRYGKTIVAGPR